MKVVPIDIKLCNEVVTCLSYMQYLVFPRVLQGTDECSVAAHGVTADGHLVWVGGEVSVDQFGELRESQRLLIS